MGRPPIGKIAMSDAERMRRYRLKHGKTKPAKPAAADHAEVAALKERIRVLEAERASPHVAAKPPDDGKEVARLRDDLRKAKMQLLMVQDDLRHQARAGAPNVLVLALQAEIKSLKGKLAQAKAQAAPPSEREVKLRETIRKLGSRLRKVVDRPPRGTLIMSKRDKRTILKCLHPDKRSAISEEEMTEAAQIFNGLSIREP